MKKWIGILLLACAASISAQSLPTLTSVKIVGTSPTAYTATATYSDGSTQTTTNVTIVPYVPPVVTHPTPSPPSLVGVTITGTSPTASNGSTNAHQTEIAQGICHGDIYGFTGWYNNTDAAVLKAAITQAATMSGCPTH